MKMNKCSHKMFHKSAEKCSFSILSTGVNPNFSKEHFITQYIHARARFSFIAICYEHSLLMYSTMPGQCREGYGDFVCYKIKTGKWFEDLFFIVFERGIHFSMLKVPCVTRNGRNLKISCEKFIT
jgi:hypothetical protein